MSAQSDSIHSKMSQAHINVEQWLQTAEQVSAAARVDESSQTSDSESIEVEQSSQALAVGVTINENEVAILCNDCKAVFTMQIDTAVARVQKDVPVRCSACAGVFRRSVLNHYKALYIESDGRDGAGRLGGHYGKMACTVS